MYLIHSLISAHLVEAHVLLGHEVGQDTAGRPGQPHVAVHHHQPSPTHSRVDEVSGAVEVPYKQM